MFVAPDPNNIILGGPGSRLNPYTHWFRPFIKTRQKMRREKIKKIYGIRKEG